MATVLVAIPDPEACERCRVDTVPFAQQAAPFVTPRTRVIEGVTYWEHDSTALARAPRLAVEAAPIAVAGGAGEDPAFDLSDVHDVALLRDGRLAAFVPLGTRLLVFGADGRGPRSLARRGQGPGELMGVSNMAIAPGDTLVAPDLGTMRLNWIDSDRGVARSDPLFGRLPTRVSDAVGVLPGGQVVMFSPGYLRPGRSSEVTRASIPLVVLPPQGAGRVIATLPGVETVMLTTRYEGRSGKEPVAVGFGRNSRAAMWDSVIATGSNDRYRIDLRNSEGTVVAAITVATRRRAVTEAMRRADIEARLKQLAEYRERPRDPAESQRLTIISD